MLFDAPLDPNFQSLQIRAILDALAPATELFREVLVAGVEQLRARDGITVSRSNDAGVAGLGSFASGRISSERFLALVGDTPEAEADVSSEAIDGARAVLASFADRGSEMHVLRLSAFSLCDGVAAALDEVGRVFGAARVLELARTKRFREDQHGRLLTAFPHGCWNRAERGLAPPLVVETGEAGHHCEGLARFLDGSQKIVIYFSSGSPPAPLARLISPRTFVQQTTDPSQLAHLARFDGPGVAALVAEDAAHFTHIPGEPIALDFLPDEKPRSPLGGVSSAQQNDALRHLASLAGCGRGAGSDASVDASVDTNNGVRPEPAAAVPAVDRLAAWLLSNTDLSNL